MEQKIQSKLKINYMPNINLTTVPFSTEIKRPGGGAEGWHNESQAVWEKSPLDSYYRFTWARLENQTLGGYNWSYFDNLINKAISRKQKFSFGIMSCYPDGDTGVGNVSFPEGGFGAYPNYLHKLMQAESVKDWRTGNTWTPNYNSPHYIARLLALHKALDAHITEMGWDKVVQFVDNRGFGAWGEWNSSYTQNNNVKDYPAGTFPTVATFKKIIDAHRDGFPNRWVLNMIAAFDGNYLQNTMIPPEVGEYALQVKNNKGLFGWRRDQWGARDGYLKDYLENNNRVNKTLIMERWKFAPITGEPMPSGDAMGDLVRQIQLYHATSFGDGNYGSVGNINELINNVRAASSAAGYKLQIESGSFTNTSLTLNWKNGGGGNTYEDWNVEIFVKSSNGTAVGKIVSSFKPKLFLPAPTAKAFTDNLTFSVPAGTYILAVKVVDPAGYRDPMPLFNAARQSDGSYNLGTITIGTTPPPANQGPTVSAGADVTTTIPMDRITLIGSVKDSDGTVQRVLWEKVSGSGIIENPTSETTPVSGLTEGTSVFKLTGTDDDNATNSDQVTVVVKPKPVDPVPNPKEVVNVTNVSTVTTVSTVHYKDGTSEKFPK